MKDRENIVSVIVTTYNQEDTIGRALDSVLCQRCHLPFEIVIGEDCSTDHTRQICQEYAERYPQQIRLICNEHNKGLLDNYFDCLLACRGKYIADCAGDDCWVDEQKLEKEVRIMEEHPEVTLVHTAWRYYNEQTHAVTSPLQQPFTTSMTNGKEMLEAIITQTRTPVIQLCTSLYRAETILKEYHANPFLFRNKDFGCEDLQIAFLMAYNGVVAYLPDVTLHYSIGHESVSTSADEKKQFRFVRRVTSLSHYLSETYHIKSPAIERYFSYRIFALAMHAFRTYSPLLRQEVLECEQVWNAHRERRTSLVLSVTRHKTLWKTALLIRDIKKRVCAFSQGCKIFQL